jgi:hypothetical protein
VLLPWHLLRSLSVSAKVVIISLRLLCLWMGDALHVVLPLSLPTNKALVTWVPRRQSLIVMFREPFFNLANMVLASFSTF